METAAEAEINVETLEKSNGMPSPVEIRAWCRYFQSQWDEAEEIKRRVTKPADCVDLERFLTVSRCGRESGAMD